MILSLENLGGQNPIQNEWIRNLVELKSQRLWCGW